MAAAGDAYVGGPTSVSDDAYYDIQPASGGETVVHNIYYGGAVEFYWYDGSNEIKFDSDSANGARLCMSFHCTNSRRVRVKNVQGSSIYIGHDGIYTKATS